MTNHQLLSLRSLHEDIPSPPASSPWQPAPLMVTSPLRIDPDPDIEIIVQHIARPPFDPDISTLFPDLINFLASIELIIAIFGIIINTLMMTVVLCIRDVRQVNGIDCITSVNASTLFCLITIVIRSSIVGHLLKIDTPSACNVTLFFNYLFLCANMYNRTFAGLDRYMLISKGLKYYLIPTTIYSKIMISFIWITSLFFSITFTATHYRHKKEDACKESGFVIGSEMVPMTLIFLIPCCLLLLIYGRILHWAYNQIKEIKSKENVVKNLMVMDDKARKQIVDKSTDVKTPRRMSEGSQESATATPGVGQKVVSVDVTENQLANLFRSQSRQVIFLDSYDPMDSTAPPSEEDEDDDDALEPSWSREDTQTRFGFFSNMDKPTRFHLSENSSYPNSNLVCGGWGTSVDPEAPVVYPTSIVKSPSLMQMKTGKRASVTFAREMERNVYISETCLFKGELNSQYTRADRDVEDCKMCKDFGIDVNKAHSKYLYRKILYRSWLLLYFACCHLCSCPVRYYIKKNKKAWKRFKRNFGSKTVSIEVSLPDNGAHCSGSSEETLSSYGQHESLMTHLKAIAKRYNIMRHLLSRRRTTEQALERAVNSRFRTRVCKLILMIGFIFMCNAGLWIPFCVFQLVVEAHEDFGNILLSKSFYILAMFSFLMDPVVFGILNNPLRQAAHARFVELFKRDSNSHQFMSEMY